MSNIVSFPDPKSSKKNTQSEENSKKIGFTVMPNDIFDLHQSYDISIEAQSIFMYFYRFNNAPIINPSFETIIKYTGKSWDSVNRYIKELISKGLLSKIKTGSGHNHYTILWKSDCHYLPKKIEKSIRSKHLRLVKENEARSQKQHLEGSQKQHLEGSQKQHPINTRSKNKNINNISDPSFSPPNEQIVAPKIEPITIINEIEKTKDIEPRAYDQILQETRSEASNLKEEALNVFGYTKSDKDQTEVILEGHKDILSLVNSNSLVWRFNEKVLKPHLTLPTNHNTGEKFYDHDDAKIILYCLLRHKKCDWELNANFLKNEFSRLNQEESKYIFQSGNKNSLLDMTNDLLLYVFERETAIKKYDKSKETKVRYVIDDSIVDKKDSLLPEEDRLKSLEIMKKFREKMGGANAHN